MVMDICKGVVFLNLSELEAALEDGDIEFVAEEYVRRSACWKWWEKDIANAAEIALENDYDVAYLIGEEFPRIFAEPWYCVRFYKLNP